MNSSAELPSKFARNRGELYLQAVNLRLRDHFDEALGVLERLQQLHPRYSRVYEERGHCYAALSDAPKAIDAFWQAVNINAALPACWQMLHTLYLGMGDVENAAKIADRLATLRSLPPRSSRPAACSRTGSLSLPSVYCGCTWRSTASTSRPCAC